MIYVTGSAINIFEEHDNSIKPIIQLRANPDSNHLINLLNKNGLYFPLISRQDYFDGVFFQESIDIKDTITLRSVNNLIQKLSSIVDTYSSLNSGQASVKYRRTTTKLPHYALHNSKTNLQTFISEKDSNIPVETANVKYHSLLNEHADSKETLKTILDTLHQDFKIGRELKHLVVVGDGKTYDLLVKLKLELKDDLSWLLPFPGDWHILKNYQRMIMKLYLDAGLKELIELFHHGAVVASVMQATNFDKTHHFLMQHIKSKREQKDRRTENSLLRKRIAWSKEQNIPISDLQQFISLPRAIVDHDGLPYKETTKIPSDWQAFLHNRENKKQLVQLVSENFCILQKALNSGQSFVIGGGFENASITKVVEENAEKIATNLQTNISESDSRAANCLKSDCNSKICGCKKINMACGPGCKCGSSCKNKNVNSQVCNTEETEEHTAEAVASTQVLYNSESGGSDFGDDTMDGSVIFEL
ncbi:unnamed protein product [Mytilus edulis]|uniref:DUF6589 domain-containing protein n=1 Tax=Mytilus edulis TaxID=6550 RepID=A0A8S3UF35_MYTED|nr:unnamed protein product [Mytilus edulis]